MNFVLRISAYVLAAFLAIQPVVAQWQVPDHAVPIGRGSGNTGFRSVAPGTVGLPFVSQGTVTDPAYEQLGTAGIADSVITTLKLGPAAATNAKIAPGAADTVKGSLDGATTIDIPLPPCTTDGSKALTYVTGTGWTCTTVQEAALIPKTATVTISNGGGVAPGIITWTGHALQDNAVVYFCNSGGALPTGLTACIPDPACSPCTANTYTRDPVLYYVVPGSQTANTFNVSLTKSGTPVNTSSAGSGTHTAFANAMACAGCVGELIYRAVNIANGVAFVTNTPVTWNNIPLTAGNWKIWGNIGATATSGTPIYDNWHATIGYGLGTATTTAPFGGINAAHIATNTTLSAGGIIFPLTPIPLMLTAPQTINANASAGITGASTNVMYGIVYAERVR